MKLKLKPLALGLPLLAGLAFTVGGCEQPGAVETQNEDIRQPGAVPEQQLDQDDDEDDQENNQDDDNNDNDS